MYNNLHEFCEDELLDGDDVGTANQILTWDVKGFLIARMASKFLSVYLPLIRWVVRTSALVIHNHVLFFGIFHLLTIKNKSSWRYLGTTFKIRITVTVLSDRWASIMLLSFHGSWMFNHTHIFHSLSIVGLATLSSSAQLKDFMPQEKVNIAFLIPLPLEFIILVYEVDVHNLKKSHEFATASCGTKCHYDWVLRFESLSSWAVIWWVLFVYLFD